jgi:DNA-binding transcriptional MerR regulator
VTTEPAIAQGLTISDLARRTGLTPATLRAWETRHGFPVPSRRASGHRRYDERDVALVRDVLRRREAGVRLEVAIADASAA